MGRWLALAINLYPPRWRARYGEEFRALVEEVRPGWREFADIVRGALIMQIANGTAFLKMAGALGVAGALLAGAASFIGPRTYVSSAAMQVSAAANNGDEYTRHEFEQMQEELLSRSRLVALIQQPGLELYRSELRRMPMEDVIRKMRGDIRIQRTGSEVHISFAYPDRWRAWYVTQFLVKSMTEETAAMNRTRTRAWVAFFDDARLTKLAATTPDVPPGSEITFVAAPNVPDSAVKPDVAGYAGWGVLLGVFTALLLWRPKWTLRVAGCAALGCAAGYGISFLVGETYVSTAALRITSPIVPEQLSGVAWTPMTERIQRLQREIPSDEFLRKLIVDMGLKLSIAQMRSQIQIWPDKADHREFYISFSCSDPRKAKQVVNKLVGRFMEQNILTRIAEMKNSGNTMLRSILEHNAGGSLELLDPASLPQDSATPHRGRYAGAGLALGALIGLCLRHHRGYVSA
jgi:capsular polysaccharide biosynthesis protein